MSENQGNSFCQHALMMMMILCLFKSSLDRRNFQHFPNLSSMEQSEENVLDNDLFIYINHMKNWQAQFKEDLSMEIPEWIISPFDVDVEHANLDTFLKKYLLK